jgi:hypothetical protein
MQKTEIVHLKSNETRCSNIDSKHTDCCLDDEGEHPELPLDLSTRPRTSLTHPGQKNSEVSIILKPGEFEKFSLNNPIYRNYIFLPSFGVFVHPLAVPPELVAPTPPSRTTSHPPVAAISKYKLTTGVVPALLTSTPSCEQLPSPAVGGSTCRGKQRTLIAVNRTQAGNGAIFCSFKTGRR